MSFDYNQSYETNPIKDDSSLYRQLLATEGVRHVQPFIMKPGIIKTDDAIQGIALKGIDTRFDWSFLSSIMYEGNVLNISDTARCDGIVLSQTLADALKLHVGDAVRMYFIQNNGIRARRFTLSGIFNSHFPEFDEKMAYVDMQYILKNLPQYETANEQLNMISRRWQKDIETAQQEAQILATNYQTEQIFLSAEMKQRREEEILAKEQEVLELKRKYFGQDGEWYKKRESLLKPIQDEIYTAIQEIANEKRYDVVKDRSAEPSLIYMSSKLDISDQVLEKLGAK